MKKNILYAVVIMGLGLVCSISSFAEVKTRADMQTQINTDLPDNISGQVSVQDVREIDINMSDSAVFPEDLNSYTSVLPTGMIDPQNTSIPTIDGGDASLFDITSGAHMFTNAYTTPTDATTSVVSCGAFDDVSVTNITTDSASFIYIDSSCVLTQATSLQSGAFLRDHVGVAILTHPNNTTITGISGFTPVSIANALMSLADMSFCQGAINCATKGQNVITGNSGTLSLDKAEGDFYLHGVNARNDNKDPNMIASSALVAPVMFIGWTVTDNVEGKLIAQTTIPAGVFDDGTAVFADALPQGSLTTNQYVNNRVFMVVDSNQIAVQIGPESYNSEAGAILGIISETFVVLPVLSGTTPLATVTMRGAASDLSDPSDANIRQAIPPRATFQ
ncbi:MAG: hypothetical protein COB09_18880 [Thalassobium sp.]|nr:MAG: hypothetical protein COB09_18880 [Thalassobium sp.]